MKRLINILFCVTCSWNVQATGQAADILIWDGDTLMLFSNPLELRKDVNELRGKLYNTMGFHGHTGCWRGYIAEWKIINKELYLTNIYSCQYYEDSLNADFKILFPEIDNQGEIKATWVSGRLLIPKGEEVHYVHSGYESYYEYELMLTFEKGQLINKQLYDNSRSHKSVFTHDVNEFRSFIYKNFNWSLLPKDEEKVIFVSTLSGRTPKPDSVEILKSSNDEEIDLEIVRVINKIPDWDIYYKRGKLVRKKIFYRIDLNDEMRERYAH